MYGSQFNANCIIADDDFFFLVFVLDRILLRVSNGVRSFTIEII